MPEMGTLICTAEPLPSSASGHWAELILEEESLLPPGNPFSFRTLLLNKMSRQEANLADLPPGMKKVRHLPLTDPVMFSSQSKDSSREHRAAVVGQDRGQQHPLSTGIL